MTRPVHNHRLDLVRTSGMSYEYYPADQTPDRHARWVCHEPHKNREPRYFRSYPAFERHVKKVHGIDFWKIYKNRVMWS